MKNRVMKAKWKFIITLTVLFDFSNSLFLSVLGYFKWVFCSFYELYLYRIS